MTTLALTPEVTALPGLRQELRIEQGAALVTGAPSWTVFDPVRHLFFQIGKIEFRIFSKWARGSFDGLSDDLRGEGLDEEEVDGAIGRVVEFSLANHLTIKPMGDTVATFARERDARRQAWWKWLVDHYLFFRMPLIKPAAFLERTLPRVAPLWSPTALAIFAALALFGLLLVSRQWDAFMASFLYFFSWQGVMAYGFGLSTVKVIHELGHAYTATRFGCRVPSMGVSFLVMFPVLYTDTTGAWRLTSRRQRLAIDCAGVAAELMVASIATLIWVVLPDGPVRSIIFVLASSSWIISLGVNLNPFMRFDGYYILSDLLGIPNLQQRAFALGRWRMRELLFGLNENPPESFPIVTARVLTLYAWITWIYRLALFLGIAVLVYAMFFKLLGIALFLVEIIVFVARPIWSELKAWRLRRKAIAKTWRGKAWIVGVIMLFVLAFIPLDRHVSAPAILAPIDAAPIVSSDPARIDAVRVKNGQHVKTGDILFELSAPELDATRSENGIRIAQLEAQLAHGASDDKDLADRSVLERELARERAMASGVAERRNRLVLRAPVDGVVTDLDLQVHAGRWVSGAEVLARVVTPGRYDIQAYVDEGDAWRVSDGASAQFVPDDLAQSSRPAKIVERAAAAVELLDQPILASTQGGAIAVSVDENKHLRPRTALYRMRLLAPIEQVTSNAIIQPVPGRVSIAAQGTSLVDSLFRAFGRIMRRESSLS
jgi:putative peptide zinc metalloprotease protein